MISFLIKKAPHEPSNACDLLNQVLHLWIERPFAAHVQIHILGGGIELLAWLLWKPKLPPVFSMSYFFTRSAFS